MTFMHYNSCIYACINLNAPEKFSFNPKHLTNVEYHMKFIIRAAIFASHNAKNKLN